MLVTLAQLSQGGSCDCYRSASPASSERSGRSRGARGPGRGTDRRGAPARTPSSSHLRGLRGACGAGRGRRVVRCRPLDTAGHRFPGARRTIEWSGRSGDAEDRLHPRASPHGLRGRSLGHEPRRQWATKVGPRLSGDALVARWSEDRFHGLERQDADERRLRDERGREREGEADERSRLGKRSGLVAGWTEDRVRPRSRRGEVPRSTP